MILGDDLLSETIGKRKIGEMSQSIAAHPALFDQFS